MIKLNHISRLKRQGCRNKIVSVPAWPGISTVIFRKAARTKQENLQVAKMLTLSTGDDGD